MTTNNTSSLKSLVRGDTFSLTPNGTRYLVTQPVKSGSGLTVVTYKVEGSGPEYEFHRAGLTTVYLHYI